MDIASQGEQILAYLSAGNALTPLDALNKFGCFRLGARIYDLKKDGYAIQTELVEIGGKRVARYHIASTVAAPS